MFSNHTLPPTRKRDRDEPQQVQPYSTPATATPAPSTRGGKRLKTLTPRSVEPICSPPFIHNAPPTAPPATFDQRRQVFEILSVGIQGLQKDSSRETGERTSIMKNDAQNFLRGSAYATVYGTAYPSGGPSALIEPAPLKLGNVVASPLPQARGFSVSKPTNNFGTPTVPVSLGATIGVQPNAGTGGDFASGASDAATPVPKFSFAPTPQAQAPTNNFGTPTVPVSLGATIGVQPNAGTGGGFASGASAATPVPKFSFVHTPPTATSTTGPANPTRSASAKPAPTPTSTAVTAPRRTRSARAKAPPTSTTTTNRSAPRRGKRVRTPNPRYAN